MPRGENTKHTDKQKREAKHIAEGSGRAKPVKKAPAKKGGKLAGAASAKRPAAARSASAKKAAATRARNKKS
jgi:hypothetical protein